MKKKSLKSGVDPNVPVVPKDCEIASPSVIGKGRNTVIGKGSSVIVDRINCHHVGTRTLPRDTAHHKQALTSSDHAICRDVCGYGCHGML